MFDGQMEMSFGRSAEHTNRRRNRANWWFQRMRRVVDLAIDWKPTPRPRPIQIWFPVTERGLAQNSVTRAPGRPPRRRNEQQMCVKMFYPGNPIT